MNFDETELMSVALIGFDVIEGPFLKWKQDYNADGTVAINMDEFAMNFYLAFKGGNESMKPRAILYDNFYIVAFPRGLELCCMFMKPSDFASQFSQLSKVAERAILAKDEDEERAADSDKTGNPGQNIDEVKRVLVNLLGNAEMSTPELRRAFNLNNSQIWKILTDLESEQVVKRTGKQGRAICWMAT
ncbi:MAG TPA: hypothetical protein VKK79_15995 [Candidatus Lokiarchaeia archaeon]|nr:hypothetical protein [Candidatus Lokiarchaeia archaeon]